MSAEDEKKIYYIICDMSKICRDYFFARKHLPNDYWQIEDVIKSISDNTKRLKNEYKEIKSKYK